MTVCYGPGATVILVSLAISFIIPLFLGVLVHALYRPKKKTHYTVYSTLIGLALFIILAYFLITFFTPECGQKSSRCVPFEIYADGTCMYNERLEENVDRCKMYKDVQDAQHEDELNDFRESCPAGVMEIYL